jgi:CCR4-NOT transcriptional regulation complex NOT5 subunit
MERFREWEKDNKTKAFSKKGLEVVIQEDKKSTYPN